jgi:hypothetical protein
VLRIHPAAEMFPLMSPDELRALGEDIKKNGLRSPPAITASKEKGKPWRYHLLDGRNRLDAMEAVGIPFSLTLDGGGCYLNGADVVQDIANVIDGDPYAYVVSANIHRRHLTIEQRQNLLIEIIARAPKKSDRQIGKEVGVDHKTIASARAKGEDVGRIPHVSTRTDTKGREQPATKTPTKDPAVAAAADRAEARSRENRRRQAAVGNGVDTQASAEQRKAEARAEPPTDDGFDALLAAWCAATDAAQERLLVTIGATRSNPHLVGEAECLRRVAPSAPVDDDPMPAIPDALRRRVAP